MVHDSSHFASSLIVQCECNTIGALCQHLRERSFVRVSVYVIFEYVCSNTDKTH